MAIIKCKMCGGDLEINEGLTVAECEYCGTTQTVPNVDDEKKVTLFARANRLRAGNEFDKASGIYESIVADFPEEAEAYWGLVLCKYGIEYVDDPATAKKIPTCHRSSFESVMDDNNFELTLEYADVVARKVYREEAKQIEEIRKGIIEVSSKEEPYDVFICYKETDEKGNRTIDSVLAQDIYDALTDKGYRTFFARITLEDKLGQEYEPYIFAALNSAKIMLAVGTDYEYYNAVWVKNEWSRFLKLMATDKAKHLIPCYKNIDAYDMPKEFAKLQAQDLGKVGAMQDLLRGIEKILPKQKSETIIVQQSGNTANSPNVDSLLKRAFMFLEDGDWKSATEYCEKVLDIDPENAGAYLGKLMAELRAKKQENLKNATLSIQENLNFKKAIRFGSEALKNELNGYIDFILEREKIAKAEATEKAYTEAVKYMEECKSSADYEKAAKKFDAILDYKDSKALKGQCLEKARELEEEENRKLEYDKKKEEAERQVSIEKLAKIRQKIAPVSNMITHSSAHTLFLRTDGTVEASVNPRSSLRIGDWRNIVAVSAGCWHVVGLKSDGTVATVGHNDHGQRNVSDWTDIVAVVAGGYHTVGLKANGTVVAVGNNDHGQCNVGHWTDIVAIAADSNLTVGLKSEGTVVVVGDNKHGQCNVSDWTDIVAVVAGGYHTVGLKADGTVVAVGHNDNGQCNVCDWVDIVSIVAGDRHTVGLKADGTVAAVGFNDDGRCNVSGWTNIVAVAAGQNVIGLKADGTVVFSCYPPEFCGEKLFNDFSNIEEELIEEKKKIKISDDDIKRYRRSQGLCQHCGGSFKGLFTKKCTSCGRVKDY